MEYNKVIHSPPIGTSSSISTHILCVSSPTIETTEEATSFLGASRIFNDKKKHLTDNAIPLSDRKHG